MHIMSFPSASLAGALVAASLAASSLVAVLGCSTQRQAADPAPAAAPSAAAQAAPSLGRAASVTVYPAALAGQPSPQVGEVVGMILERGGMTNLALASTSFTPAKGNDLATDALGFAAQVRGDAIATDYALFCSFLGTPGHGVDEVRTILVARDGTVVWSDRQAKGDRDFAEVAPAEPMQCCLLVVKRLTPVLSLGDPNRADAPEGPLAARWKRETGVPTEAETAAMTERAATLRSRVGTAAVAVFTPHAPASAHASAEDLAKAVAATLPKATAVAGAAEVRIRSGMNQQMVLWSMARSFGEFIQRHPPEADYALMTDYLMGTGPSGEPVVAGVHLALCDRAGNLVLVDYQNSHQADFKAVHPTTREECDRLVARRLQALLR